MKNVALTWIFLISLILLPANVYAVFSENSRQGFPAISVTSQPGLTDESAEPQQGSGLRLRIFTADSLFGFNGGMNLYRYADNNPVRWVDPWGLFIEMPINDQARAELLLISETFLQAAPSDYRFAVKLFQHSLQDSPENLIFSESSWQSDYLRQSKKLESEIEKFVLTLPNGGSAIDVINVSVLLNSPRSYFYAINKALINMKGSICKTSNAQFNLELDSLIVKDVYDFADMGNKDFYRKEIAVAANQLAFSYQESGVIVPYRWYAKLGNYKLSR